MWLLSKPEDASAYARTPVTGTSWDDIPKNPVFYPPTPKRHRNTSLIKESPIVEERKRSGTLLRRLKTIFVPKNTATPEFAEPELHKASSHQAIGGRESKLSAFRRSRLVARSPIREESISPDLRALAEIESLPSPSPQVVKLDKPSHTVYSSTIFYARPPRAAINRMQFVKSVYSPRENSSANDFLAGQDCDCAAGNTAGLESPYNPMIFAPRVNGSAEPTKGVYRSQSLSVPLRAMHMPEPLETGYDEPPESPVLGFRASRASEFTAIAATSLRATDICDDTNDCPFDLSSPPSPRVSYSPSQRTLPVTDDSLSAQIAFFESEIPLPPLPLHPQGDVDVFDSVSREARRPYSEGYSESVEYGNRDFALYAEDGMDDIVPDLCGHHYRAMYIRTSCADADLVKSTFDLAKLLPSAPS
ncbi:hypothetical protein GGI07_001036 [Coemansia sp. Benny D115]|nr:hypothetical protein GGI07_001036 [Coemansia sp. Benny D115]